MARRSRIFELYAQGLTPVEMQRMVSAEYDISERTIRDDLNQIDAWLPELVKLKATSEQSIPAPIGYGLLVIGVVLIGAGALRRR